MKGCGSGSLPKCHGSATLQLTIKLKQRCEKRCLEVEERCREAEKRLPEAKIGAETLRKKTGA
jgi:hypothetical protein